MNKQGIRDLGPGVSPLAMETAQKILKSQKDQEAQINLLKLICIILFVVSSFSVLFAGMLTFKNVKLAEENLQLTRENQLLLRLTSYQLQGSLTCTVSCSYMYNLLFRESSNENNDNDADDPQPLIDSLVERVPEKFANMIDARAAATCLPCTTPPTLIIEPHRNPVSILNQLTHLANYDCETHCLNPPIHVATLVVDEEHMKGKTFTGKGISKQESKQVAAYRAIEFGYKDRLDDIVPELKPDLNYNPRCLSVYQNATKDNDKVKC